MAAEWNIALELQQIIWIVFVRIKILHLLGMCVCVCVYEKREGKQECEVEQTRKKIQKYTLSWLKSW